VTKNNNDTLWFEIVPPNPPNDGVLFVDHSKTGRSGHLGHALVEYAPGKVLAFYANCSDFSRKERLTGHNGDGWMEYKRSEDGGRTWGEPSRLPYSRQVYEQDNDRSVMCEKAVLAPDGSVVLFNLESLSKTWEPWTIPTCLRSVDGGATWDRAQPLSDQPGRIYDAMTWGDEIFVLEHCNDAAASFYGSLPHHHYGFYVSADSGTTFVRRSVPPFSYNGRAYGTMALLADGSLIVYVYNINDEKRLDYTISRDAGHTWSAPRTAFMAKQIRNPQMAAFKDGFVLHGRSGSMGSEEEKGHFVLYTSRDGVKWDAGRYLRMRDAEMGAYSNNLLVTGPDASDAPRLLIQVSHAYELSKTNILHWWLR